MFDKHPVIPGAVWWKVDRWLDSQPLEGNWESEWFHSDAMLVVNAGPVVKFRVGILPVGFTTQKYPWN